MSDSVVKWTFEVQWPSRVAETEVWTRSAQRFETVEDAAQALMEYLSITAINGIIVSAKLYALTKYDD